MLWPGVPQLWHAGSWVGLAVASGFAVLLNVGLVCTRLWTELLSPEVRAAVWIVAAVVWLVSLAVSRRWLAAWDCKAAADGDKGLFNIAQSEYLMGNWFEAETSLRRLLAANPSDIEGRLLYASVLRQTQRFDEAGEQIKRLKRIDGAEGWQLEIGRLEQRIARQEREDQEAESEDSATSEQHISQAA